MPASLKGLLDEANSVVPRVTPEEAKAMVDRGEAVLVDVRDGVEIERTGKAQGALAIPRGLLEFKADPEAPGHEAGLSEAKAVILYCGAGGRAALAGKTLKDFGYERVFNMGGFVDWANAGLPVEE